jgi:multiple sugar transport system substrate-binding protein
MEGQRPPVSRRTRRREFLRTGILVAGAGLALPLLAACSSTPVTPAPPVSGPAPAKPADASKPAESKPAAAAPAQSSGATGDIKLTAWFTDRRSINDMTEKEAMPEFQAKNPGITVEVQFVPEAQIQQKLLAAKAANNAPDLTAIDETFEDTLWKNKALVAIPPAVMDVRAEMGAKVADLYKLPPGSAQGEYFGLPNGTFGGALYYNEDLLAELKYTPEQIPTKWDDFLKWAKDITKWNGNTLERSGFAIFGSDDSVRSEYRIQKGGWQDGNLFPTKDTVLLARDLEYEAIKFVMDIYDVHKLDAKDGVTYQDKFGTGKAVTAFAWTWNNGFFETQYKMQNYGIKLAPHVDPSKKDWPHGAAGPDVGFCVTTQSTNQAQVDATWKLWRYLVGPEYLKRYAILRGVQPSLKAMWTDPAFSTDKSGKKWAALADKMSPGRNLDSGFNSIELGTILARAMPQIRDENADPKVVLPAIEKDANEYLKANPQWSILSAADYKAHPEWLKPEG